MIEIELTEPNRSICGCCGGTNTSLTRFVYQNGDAYAVYYVMFSETHMDDALAGVISLGGWGSEDLPENRVAFPFVLWHDENGYKISLTDSNESPWHDVEILGRMLDRNEALNHPWINDVFHITDHIAENDSEVIDYFKLDSSMIN